jgi:hypothetical protein
MLRISGSWIGEEVVASVFGHEKLMLSRDYVAIDCGRRGVPTLIVNVGSSAHACLIVSREYQIGSDASSPQW